MAESLIHELNAEFNDMNINAKKETKKRRHRKRGKNIDKKSVFSADEKFQDVEHCMPNHSLTDSQNITYVCESCGGNLYSDIIKADPSNQNLYYKLICPRGCRQLPGNDFEDQRPPHIPRIEDVYIPDYQPHPLSQNNGISHNMPMNGGYTTGYNPYQPQYMATKSNNDYIFEVTTNLLAARTARLNQLLNAVDCDNCHPMTIKETTNRFEKFKRKNVRRAEYQLRTRNYGDDGAGSTPDFSSDLSTMAEGMFEYSERVRRFYEQTQYGQGCDKCGGLQ